MIMVRLILLISICMFLICNGDSKNSYSALLHAQIQNETLVQSVLPVVYILPVDDVMNIKFPKFREKRSWPVHSNQVLIHRWLRNHYWKTTLDYKKADLVFLPIYSLSSHPDYSMVQKIIQEAYFNESTSRKIFSLDKTFIATSFPLSACSLIFGKLEGLNIKYLRVDNFRPFLGRISMSPYVLNSTDFHVNSAEPLIKRDNFIFSPCARVTAVGMDSNREFRTKSCQILKNSTLISENSVIGSERIDGSLFIKYLKTSDFCFIYPGDTPATAKLYKSLMSGCIPVYFISFKNQLPFNHLINWSKFVIIVQKEIIHNEKKMISLLRYLHKIRNDTIKLEEYKRNVLNVAKLFDFDRYEWPSVYHLILLDLISSSGLGNNFLQHFKFKDWRFTAKEKVRKRKSAENIEKITIFDYIL